MKTCPLGLGALGTDPLGIGFGRVRLRTSCLGSLAVHLLPDCGIAGKGSQF